MITSVVASFRTESEISGGGAGYCKGTPSRRGSQEPGKQAIGKPGLNSIRIPAVPRKELLFPSLRPTLLPRARQPPFPETLWRAFDRMETVIIG